MGRVFRSVGRFGCRAGSRSTLVRYGRLLRGFTARWSSCVRRRLPRSAGRRPTTVTTALPRPSRVSAIVGRWGCRTWLKTRTRSPVASRRHPAAFRWSGSGSGVMGAELGETADPKELVPGNVEAVTRTLAALRRYGDALHRASTGLRRVDTGRFRRGDRRDSGGRHRSRSAGGCPGGRRQRGRDHCWRRLGGRRGRIRCRRRPRAGARHQPHVLRFRRPSVLPTSEGQEPAERSRRRSCQAENPVQGSGGLRPRRKNPKGKIYEWDSQHGEIDKYSKRGKHEGVLDPDTGEPIPGKGPESGREVEP